METVPDTFSVSPAGTSPIAITTADLNGDGNADLIVANSGSNTVSVLISNGDGTFVAAQGYAVGTSPTAVAAADVNGDGHIDVAVANSGSNTVTVFLGSGDGSLQMVNTYNVGTTPVALAVANVSGGLPDLLVANQGSQNENVLANNGSGTFTLSQTINLSESVHSIAVANFGGGMNEIVDGELEATGLAKAVPGLNAGAQVQNMPYTGQAPPLQNMPYTGQFPGLSNGMYWQGMPPPRLLFAGAGPSGAPSQPVIPANPARDADKQALMAQLAALMATPIGSSTPVPIARKVTVYEKIVNNPSKAQEINAAAGYPFAPGSVRAIAIYGRLLAEAGLDPIGTMVYGVFKVTNPNAIATYQAMEARAAAAMRAAGGPEELRLKMQEEKIAREKALAEKQKLEKELVEARARDRQRAQQIANREALAKIRRERELKEFMGFIMNPNAAIEQVAPIIGWAREGREEIAIGTAQVAVGVVTAVPNAAKEVALSVWDSKTQQIDPKAWQVIASLLFQNNPAAQESFQEFIAFWTTPRSSFFQSMQRAFQQDKGNGASIGKFLGEMSANLGTLGVYGLVKDIVVAIQTGNWEQQRTNAGAFFALSVLGKVIDIAGSPPAKSNARTGKPAPGPGSGTTRLRSTYQGGPYPQGRFGRGGTLWQQSAEYRSGQVRIERLVRDAARQAGLDVDQLVDEIVYIPGTNAPFFEVLPNGRRIIGLPARTVFGQDATLRLQAALHELGHAWVESQGGTAALFGQYPVAGGIRYAAEEIFVERFARTTLQGQLSRRALRNSVAYENFYRAQLGLPALPLPP